MAIKKAAGFAGGLRVERESVSHIRDERLPVI